MRRLRRFLTSISIVVPVYCSMSSAAPAQNAGNIINLFGGMIQGAIVQTNIAEWRKLPQPDFACIEQALRNNGVSLQAAIERGLTPSDPRISEIRTNCRIAATPTTAPDAIHFVTNTRPPDAYLSLRTDPSSSSGRRITTMPNGTPLRVIRKQDNGWWYVELLSSGQKGWALSRGQDRHFIECCITTAEPKPNVAPTAANAVKEQSEVLWSLNGSTLYLVASGRSRKFFYKEPRPAIREFGVRDGSLLFEGETFGSQYQGTAYFSGKCGRSPVAVAGPILDGFRRVELTGRAPTFDAGCRITGFTQSTLALQLIEPNIENAPVANTPSSAPGSKTSTAVIDDAADHFRSVKDKALENDADAQLELGHLYLDGKGIKKDEAEGIKWLRKSADQGSVRAEASMGDAYMYGRGVSEDSKEAALWYEKAAAKDDPGSQYKLGLLYDKGLGVDASGTKAMELIRKAAQNGQPDAKKYLAQSSAILAGIKTASDRIASRSKDVANSGLRQSLQAIASRLSFVTDLSTRDELMRAQKDVDEANKIFADVDMFDRVSPAAKRRLDAIDEALAKLRFDAPPIRRIKETVVSARNALVAGDLKALRESLSTLDQIYDPAKVEKLREATLNGFSSIEDYELFLADRAKLSRSGIILKKN